MLGTIVNNRQLIELKNQHRLDIKPFSPDKLKTIHYSLSAKRYLSCSGRHGSEPEFETRKEFDSRKSDYKSQKVKFEAKEYLVAEILESVTIDEGIVGHFIPSSRLIDFGFGITCGRLQAPYGSKGEVIRFGVYNLLDKPNELLATDILAHVYFIDLRALSSDASNLTSEDRKLFERWIRVRAYQADDGIHPLGEKD